MRARRLDGDAGFFMESVVVGGTALAIAVGVALATFARLHDERPTFSEATQAIAAPAEIFIGPGLSSVPELDECMLAVARRRGLVWAGPAKGWRSPQHYPEPSFSLLADAATQRGVRAAWTEQMESYIRTVRPEWDDCVQPVEEPATATTLPPAKVGGLYVFQFQTSNPSCTWPPPQLDIPIPYDQPFRLLIPGPPQKPGQPKAPDLPIPGKLDPQDLTFTARTDVHSSGAFFPGAAETQMDFSIEFRGHFDTDVVDKRSIIREGAGEARAVFDGEAKSCTFTFTAKRKDG